MASKIPISDKRAHLVDVAARLFNHDGFRATGIDTILAKSGVAKMTLYNHFKSKEELILAALRHMDQQWRESFVAAVERRASKPANRLLAIFDALEEWFGREDFCGCACVKACCEFPGVKEPAHRIASQHHEMVYSYIRGLAADAGAPDPDVLATRLMLLLRGAIVWAQISGKADAASHAREAGKVLIRDVIGRTSRGKSRKTP